MSYKRSAILTKVAEAMEFVHDRLIEQEKKIKGEIVVMKDGKIVRIKF